MQVAKWGNSLAIRLPSAIVETMGLEAGDHVEIVLLDDRTMAIQRDPARRAALERLRGLKRPLPAGFRLDREELHERGSDDT